MLLATNTNMTRRGPSLRLDVRVVVACASIFVTTLAGCEKPSTRAESVPQVTATPGGTFTTLTGLPRRLDPPYSDDDSETMVINQIFDGLVTLDKNLLPGPAIAEYWEISPDRLHYRFFLRRGVRFQNGRTVMSDDFIYSFRRILQAPEDTPSPGRDALRVIEGARDFIAGKAEELRGMRAPDPYTLEIDLEEPHHGFLSALASASTKVVPREEIERSSEEEFSKHPVGAGPFRLQSWTDKELVLARFDGYYGRAAYLDEVHFVSWDSIADPMVALDRFRSGQFDIVPVFQIQLADLKAENRFPLLQHRDPSLYFLGMNTETPPFDDPRVRKAIAHAIDREAVVKVSREALTKATGLVPPGYFGYSVDESAIKYDPAEARRLLAEAGHPDGAGIPPLTFYLAWSGEAEQEVVRQLKEIGITLRIRPVHRFLLERALVEKFAPIFEMGYAGEATDGDDFLFTLFHSTGSKNYFGYANREVETLGEQSLRMQDSRIRYNNCRRIEQLVLEDAPVIPLYHYGEVYVLQPRVRGFVMGPFGIADLPFEDVWFDQTPDTP
ncbi:MAG: peptide ABC transporter substrate-binding protein [Planctomycetes bacterium]|nr:peptide ABC transporter substrate-binding protein [Planctomycetota bacterium]MBI3847071.1 peptide ABC transporter substrate-binding protein [Planctomycetota bacterium]